MTAKNTFSKIPPSVVTDLDATSALVGGYLAGNKAGFCPNIKAVSSILKLNRSVVVRAIYKLDNADLISRSPSGGWSATPLLTDMIKGDSFAIPTSVLTDSSLTVLERLLLGYLNTNHDHGLDDIVATTGLTASTVSRHTRLLEERRLIVKDRSGGGRGKKRHFFPVNPISISPVGAVNTPAPDTKNQGIDYELYDEIRAEILWKLGDSVAWLNPEIYNLVVELLTEIHCMEPSEKITIGSNQMFADDAWNYLKYVDWYTPTTVASRLADRWPDVVHKKEYLLQALINDCKSFADESNSL